MNQPKQIKLESKFHSNQEWASDPDQVNITLPLDFISKAQQAIIFLKENGFHEITCWGAAQYELLIDEDGDGLVEFEPEFSLDGCNAIVFGSDSIKFEFPFKFTEEKGWTDTWTITDLKELAIASN